MSAALSEGQTGESTHEVPIPLWFMKDSFKSEEAFTSFTELLTLRCSLGDSNTPYPRQNAVDSSEDPGSLSSFFPLCDRSNGASYDLTTLEQVSVDIQRFSMVEGTSRSGDSSGMQLLIVSPFLARSNTL